MKLTKPAKEKRHFISHSDDFSEKENEVRLGLFNASDGKTLLNLIISAKSSSTGQSSTLVLHPTQLDILEKAIKEYKDKNFPYQLIEI